MSSPQQILLIDDDQLHIKFVNRVFERTGENWELDWTSDIDEALELMGSKNYSAIILDYSMPNMTGPEMIERIGTLDQDCPILMFTGFDDAGPAVASLRAGAFDYIVKSSETVQHIPLLVRRAIDRYRLEKEQHLLRQPLLQEKERVDRENKQLSEQYERLELAQTELARAYERLMDLNRLKSEFISTISHEFRTPLHAILGYTSLLRDRDHGPLTDRQSTSLECISRRGRQLLQMVNDVLDLSRLQAHKMPVSSEPFLIADVFREVEENAKPLLTDKTITLELKNPANLAMNSDKIKVRQILLNLTSNAIKFTDQGKVSIAARLTDDDTSVEFSVYDTGVGIEEIHLPTIFEVFRQLDGSSTRAHGGAGLGLALVKQMVILLNGQIDVSSHPGAGTTFNVVLPRELSNPAEEAETDDSVPEDAPLVLSIEDNEEAIRMYREALTLEGIRFVGALTAAAGLEKIRRLKPALVLLDIWLPDTNGWEVLAELKNSPDLKDIPVVVLSAVADPEHAREKGAEACLLKPVSFKELGDLVTGILNRKASSP